ncbi:MAG: hypothetical protein COB88_02995 [Flavobacteriales bacterium]|nr:MAG: hypothetical protein COB88_02995 [Flavobacteriales bacterium]
MKKFTISLFLSVLMTGFVFAQNKFNPIIKIPANASVIKAPAIIKGSPKIKNLSQAPANNRQITNLKTSVVTNLQKSGFKNAQSQVPGTVYLDEGFDSTGVFLPSGWSSIDQDGDGLDWSQGLDAAGAGTRNGSVGCAYSASWDGGVGPLTPENYMVTPAIDLSSAGSLITLSYWVYAQDQDWPAEHYKVVVSKTGSTKSDFDGGDNVLEETLIATGNGVYVERTVDLSSYVGDTINIAWIHFNSTDNFWMNIDDVLVEEPKNYDAVITGMSTSLPEHTIIPLSQAPTMDLMGSVASAGLKTITGISLNANVVGGTATTANLDSIQAGNDSNLTTSPSFDPSKAGNYAIAYDVSINETDEDTTNNVDTLTVIINDSLYTKDYTILGVVAGNISLGSAGTMGNLFQLDYADTLTSIILYLDTLKLNDSLQLVVIDWSDTSVVYQSAGMTVDTAETEGAKNYNIPDLYLDPGSYIIGVIDPTGNSAVFKYDGNTATGESYFITTGNWVIASAFGAIGIWPSFGIPAMPFVPDTCDTNTLVVITSSMDVSCAGGDDGMAMVSVSGGTSPYMYHWDDPNDQLTDIAVDLQAGGYWVSVIDAKGCWIFDSVYVDEPWDLDVEVWNTDASCGNADGTAMASAYGGTSPYWYYWSTGDSTADISSLAAGPYGLSVTGNNSRRSVTIGASGHNEATITCFHDIVASVIAIQFSICFRPLQDTRSICFEGIHFLSTGAKTGCDSCYNEPSIRSFCNRTTLVTCRSTV